MVGEHQRPSPPLHLGQRRLRLRQPEGHLQGTVQVDGRCQLGTGLLSPAAVGVEGAEAVVAVGLQRAHAKLRGQGQGLLVVGFGMRDIRGMALGGDLTEEPQRIGLVSAFLLRTGALEGPLGECKRVLLAVSQVT